MKSENSYKILPAMQVLEQDQQSNSQIKLSVQNSLTLRKFFDDEGLFCSLLFFQLPSSFPLSLLTFLTDEEASQKLQTQSSKMNNSSPLKYKPVLITGIEASTPDFLQKIAVIDAVDLFSFIRFSTTKDEFSLRLSIITFFISSHICLYLKDTEPATLNQEFVFLNTMTEVFHSCISQAATPSLIIFLRISDQEAEKYSDLTFETFLKQIPSPESKFAATAFKHFKSVCFFPVILDQNGELQPMQLFSNTDFFDAIAEYPKTTSDDIYSSTILKSCKYVDFISQSISVANASTRITSPIKTGFNCAISKLRENLEKRVVQLKVHLEVMIKNETYDIRNLATRSLSDCELATALACADKIDALDVIKEFEEIKTQYQQKAESLVSAVRSEFDEEIAKVAKYQPENVAGMITNSKEIEGFKKNVLDGKLIDNIFENEVQELAEIIDKRKRELYYEAQSVRIRVLRKHVNVCDYPHDCPYAILHTQNHARKWIEHQGICYAYFFNYLLGRFHYFSFGMISDGVPLEDIYS